MASGLYVHDLAPAMCIVFVRLTMMTVCLSVSDECVLCAVFEMTSQSVDSFLRCFTRHVHILDATVAVKQDFADIVDSQDNLRLIQLPSWAGLGAVQYAHFLCHHNHVTHHSLIHSFVLNITKTVIDLEQIFRVDRLWASIKIIEFSEFCDAIEVIMTNMSFKTAKSELVTWWCI